MMRTTLEKRMNEIEAEVIKLGNLAKEAITMSVKSLKEQSVELAENVIKIEEETDLLNLRIEERCMHLTATQQPVAKDLRFIAAMMRISSNFERIADMGEKIAVITKKTAHKPLLKPLIDVPKMAETCIEMIDIDLHAISNKDVKPIEQLSKKDDIIDALYQQVYNELLTYIMKDPKCVDDATHLLFVALHLERAGDIAAKTGARIVYMVEGKKVWIK